MPITNSFAQEQADKVSIDVRRQSALTKVKLLAHGVQDAPTLFSGLNEFKEEHYAYDNGNWGVDCGRLIPSELLLPGGITAKVHVRPSSSLHLEWDGHQLLVMQDRICLSEAATLPRPKFWDYATVAGIQTKTLAHFYGATCINFNIFSACQFFDANTPCQFCSVQPTQDIHHGVVIRKSPEDLADTCRLAVAHDKVEWFLETGGSYFDGNYEFDQHVAVLSAVRHHLPWSGRLRGNVSLMPPRDLERLAQLYELGVDHPSFNLETWPQTSFERICPGKAKYVGFQHIMAAYDRLVSIYGPGRAWCNFVAGLAPLRDQKDGFKALADHGVVPGANVYHPDVGSRLGMTLTSPSESYIIDLYQYAAELYQQYNYRPFFDSAVLRNSLANEAFEGLL